MSKQKALTLQEKKENLEEYVAAHQNKLENAMGDYVRQFMEPTEMQAKLTNAISKNNEILKCTKTSVLRALIAAGEVGLDPSGRGGQGYIVPFYDKHKGQKVATFIPGYKGLRLNLKRAGVVKEVNAEVVWKEDKDNFKEKRGLHPDLIHNPTCDGYKNPKKAWKEIHAAYAVAQLPGNEEPHFTVVRKPMLERIRNQAPGGDATIASTWPEKWAKKTAVRQLAGEIDVDPDSIAGATIEKSDESYGEEEPVDMGEAEIVDDGEEKPESKTEQEKEDLKGQLGKELEDNKPQQEESEQKEQSKQEQKEQPQPKQEEDGWSRNKFRKACQEKGLEGSQVRAACCAMEGGGLEYGKDLDALKQFLSETSDEELTDIRYVTEEHISTLRETLGAGQPDTPDKGETDESDEETPEQEETEGNEEDPEGFTLKPIPMEEQTEDVRGIRDVCLVVDPNSGETKYTVAKNTISDKDICECQEYRESGSCAHIEECRQRDLLSL